MKRCIGVWACLLVGCGAGCPREAADHTAFLEQEAEADDQPDGHLDVPFALLDHLLANELARVPALPLPVPGLGTLSVVPLAARSRPAGPNRLGFTVEFVVKQGQKTLFSLGADTEVTPQIEGNHLGFTLGPEALRALRPRLGPEANAAMAALLRSHMPAPLRLALSAARLRTLTDEALGTVANAVWALLRDGAAADLMPRIPLQVALPALPIHRLTLRSRAGWLEVGLLARLPAGDGAQPPPAAQAAPSANQVRLRLSGAAVSALGNQAITDGHLPARYSEKGKADPQGPMAVALGWAPEARPLKVLVWQTEGTCVQARLGGTPRLAVQTKGGTRELEVRLTDGVVEDISGSLLVEAGAWLTGAWDRTLKFTQNVAAETRMEVAGRPLKLALADGAVSPQGLVLTLEVSR